MKLQTQVCAERDGAVAEIPFAVGQSFEQGATLARFEPVAKESPE
jgi:biotin carboxyl carrier protein